MTRRDRTDPEGEYRREGYGLNEQQDDVFCAREGNVILAEDVIGVIGINRADEPTITDLVHEVINQREKIGQATYGRPLLAGDGRDTLQDAIEEAADLLQYLVKLKTERDTECP